MSTENHKKAAKHHEDAAKHHNDAAKHHEAGNHNKAAESTVKANRSHNMAHECQREDASGYDTTGYNFLLVFAPSSFIHRKVSI